MRAVTRRPVLVAMLLAPAVWGVGACSLLRDDRPDPLLALADQARVDVALATAVAAADGVLAARVEPVRAARAAHAEALEVEIARRTPDALRAGAGRAEPGPDPGVDTQATLAGLRDALAGSGEAAGTLALRLPPERTGLVASVAACCTAYAELLA